MRRRNVPCSPCGSGSSDCGCCPPKSVKKINDIEPDDNGKFEIRAGTNVTITDITNGIEISSAGSAEDVVKSVNGELPDQDGDVTIDTGVLTVNGVSADADGEFTVSGGQNVTVTETVNGIEISAEGGSPEAVAPIYIDQDGKIAFKNWSVVTSTDWSGFIENGLTTEDLYLVVSENTNNLYGEGYLPKGTNIYFGRLDITGSSHVSSTWKQIIMSVQYVSVFNASNRVTAYPVTMATSESQSGTANHTFTITMTSASIDIYKVPQPDGAHTGIALFKRS